MKGLELHVRRRRITCAAASRLDEIWPVALSRLAVTVMAKCQQGLNITGFNQSKENMKGRKCEWSSKYALLLNICYFQLLYTFVCAPKHMNRHSFVSSLLFLNCAHLSNSCIYFLAVVVWLQSLFHLPFVSKFVHYIKKGWLMKCMTPQGSTNRRKRVKHILELLPEKQATAAKSSGQQNPPRTGMTRFRPKTLFSKLFSQWSGWAKVSYQSIYR